MSARTPFPACAPGAVVLSVVCLLLLLSVPVPSSAQQPDATGLIVSMSGSVSIQGPDGVRDAIEGAVLRDGDAVLVKSGGSCRGFAPLGEPFSLSGPAELAFAPSSAEKGVSAVYAWVRRQITGWIGENRFRPLTTRAARDWEYAAQAPAPLVPAAGGSVRPDRARFRWTALQGVSSYEIVVAPSSGAEMRRSARGQSVVLDDLSPGAAYVWKVRPAVEGWSGESSWREFRVLTPDEERELNEALKHLDDLEAGVLLLSAGLHEEAVQRFDAAVSAQEVARSARLWRARAFADIGLYREAYEDLRLSQEGLSW